jgi:branched-chain amino acid transport system permease protein
VEVFQVLVGGIAQGCVYGLIALGIVLIYKATESVTFAQGDLMMLGAFLGFVLLTALGFPFWITVPSVIAAMGLFGLFVERLVIRPILGQPTFSIVMLTFGIAYMVRGLVTMIPGIGTETHKLPVPYAGQTVSVGGVVIPVEFLVAIAATAVLCLLLYLLFRRSRIGIAMQAASQNQLAAYYMGIPVQKINGLVWALAAAVAAVAGLMLAPITFVHAQMGMLGLTAFAAAIVGGFTSLPGAIVGGLIIGVVGSLAGFYLPEGFKNVAPYVVVLLMLMIRPNGLFGERLGKKV